MANSIYWNIRRVWWYCYVIDAGKSRESRVVVTKREEGERGVSAGEWERVHWDGEKPARNSLQKAHLGIVNPPTQTPEKHKASINWPCFQIS